MCVREKNVFCKRVCIVGEREREREREREVVS